MTTQVPTLRQPQTLSELGQLIQKHKTRILDALPKGVDGEQVLKKAMLAIRKNRDLLKCSPASLFYAVSESIANGLEIGGIRSHAYLVPYGQEATLIVSYKGLIELVRRTGQLETISLELVHEGDVFEYQLGDHPFIRHVPSVNPARGDSPVTHVYCVMRFHDGGVQRVVWTSAQVNAHRDRYSQAYQRAERYREAQERAKKEVEESRLSPWHTSWATMAKKTIVRDMVQRGLVPLSEDHREIVSRETTIEEGRVVDRDKSLDDVIGAAIADDIQPQQQDEVPAIESLAEAAKPEAEPEPEIVFSGVGDEGLLQLLGDAKTIKRVHEIRDICAQQCQDEDELAYVEQFTAARLKELRKK